MRTKSRFGIMAAIALASLPSQANQVDVQIRDLILTGGASPDTITLSFDDGAGSSPVPYWLNGWVSSSASVGYAGTLTSKNYNYVASVYIGFYAAGMFNIFQDCSPSTKCYLELGSPTNLVPTTIDPTAPNNLGHYLVENLVNLAALAGPNAGWNISFNTPPMFPETAPWLQVVKPDNIVVSSVPEPMSSILAVLGLGFALIRKRYSA